MKNRKREDEGMGYLLQYENVAWFDEEKKEVRILDRRIFPQKKEFVLCSSYQEVAKAIKDMVTQSGGQFAAGAMGMVLASSQFKHLPKHEFLKEMENAKNEIINARPTTKEAMELIVNSQFALFNKLIKEGSSSYNIVKALKQNAIELNNERYNINAKAGEYFAKIVKDGQSVLTHCFGETCFAAFLRSFNEDKKIINIYCQETRPFLQGAKLTASLANDLGFSTTLITDGMVAFLMSQKKIDYFVTASDVITQDMHVINKVGTFNTAIVANYFSVPYYAIGIISQKHKTLDNIKIEMRNGEEITNFNGVPITANGVKGIYPSFDITPPNLIKGIATPEGIFEVESNR